MTLLRSVFPLLACVGMACTTDASTAAADATGSSSSSSGGASTSSSSASDDASTAGEPKLDVNVATVGCEKIDFLFVIDNSLSMGDEQQLLIDGFPGFISGIEQTIAAFDYHIMVVASSALERSFDPCEATLGAGLVRSADGTDCGLVEDFLWGDRFMSNELGDLEDLKDTFACVAQVGTAGQPNEASVWAMAEAVTSQAGENGCNAGFLRQDAILVVTFITDEEDDPNDGPPLGDTDINSPGNPQEWKDGLVAVKGGDEEAIVLLALVGDTELPDAVCSPFDALEGEGAEPSPRLREFADSFTYGAWSPVCVADYAPFFNEALSAIENSCEGFQPPG